VLLHGLGASRMARIRTVKPELAAHEGMFDLEEETGLPVRFAWVMLFTVADREGRFPWRPRTIKAQTLPHDNLDFSRVLDAWLTRGFVMKYRVGDDWFGCIPTFTKHQVINNRESASDLPSIDDADEVIASKHKGHDACATRAPREDDACLTREVHAQAEGRKEGKESTRDKHAQQFDELWKSWPEDMGEKGNRKRALDQWLRLKPAPEHAEEIRASLEQQVLTKRELRAQGQFAANFQHVERWIRDRGWENHVGSLQSEPLEHIL